jgi:outer membrane protein OmpA-like peptidoglycan-associated protein
MKLLKIIACMAVAVATATVAGAQDYDAYRTNTWSVYGQAGVSWATGLDFKNVNQSSGTGIAPEIGTGVNYNLRPWVRFGLNYEFSKYKREQRYSAFRPVPPMLDMIEGPVEDIKSTGGMIYYDMWTMYHDLDLTAEFNIMEIWKNRKSKRFNLYAGTGVGVMFGRSNLYSLGMGHNWWLDPRNHDEVGLEVSDNYISQSWVRAGNARDKFTALYIPVVLMAEYDITPRFTVGLKGQYKAIFSKNAMAAAGTEVLAITARWNFLCGKHGFQTNKQKYNDLAGKYDDLQDANNKLADDAAQAKKDYEDALAALNDQNDALKDQLADALTPENVKETVLFEPDESTLAEGDIERLKALADEMKANPEITISLVGEASADGDFDKNQALSERRLASVVKALGDFGIGSDRITQTGAIGEDNKINQRRVKILINE